MAKKKKDEPDASPPTAQGLPSPPGQQAPAGENGAQGPRRPVATFKCASSRDTYVEAAVWENEVNYQDGSKGTQYVVSFSRSYKNGEGWKTNHSYRAHDLVILEHLLRRAHAWVTDQRVIHDVPVAAPVNGTAHEPIPF